MTNGYAEIQRGIHELRNDIGNVLVYLFMSLDKSSEEARSLLGPMTENDVMTCNDINEVNDELHALRREVAVVMANLMLAAGGNKNQIEGIVLMPLGKGRKRT